MVREPSEQGWATEPGCLASVSAPPPPHGRGQAVSTLCAWDPIYERGQQVRFHQAEKVLGSDTGTWHMARTHSM